MELVPWIMRTLPANFVLGISRWASRTSRDHSGMSDGEHWLDRYQEKVVEPLWSSGQRVVICGHHHVGTVRSTGQGVLVNLGHWLEEPMFAVREEGVVRLFRDHADTAREIGRVELIPSETQADL